MKPEITDRVLDTMYGNLKEQKPDLTDEVLLRLLADVLRYTGNSKKRVAKWYTEHHYDNQNQAKPDTNS